MTSSGLVRVLATMLAFASCGPRNGFLEVTFPFGPDAEGLSAQVRLVRASGTAGSVSSVRLVDATRGAHAYSIEVTTEPSAVTVEVCLCDGAEPCFRADGTCRGVGDVRGGLYRFAHERTGFIGERTRWTANLCPTEAEACPLADPAGSAIDVPVDRCAVEGCCPFCNPGRYCTDPSAEIHRCE